jgi:hypothetical protein
MLMHGFAYRHVLTKRIPSAATLSMLRVANAIYSVLELACKGNRKVAPAFVEHMSIFDRHLGTQVKSAMLMRELYCNRQMLVTPNP